MELSEIGNENKVVILTDNCTSLSTRIYLQIIFSTLTKKTHEYGEYCYQIKDIDFVFMPLSSFFFKYRLFTPQTSTLIHLIDSCTKVQRRFYARGR